MALEINQDFHSPRKLEKALLFTTLIVVAGHAAGSIWLYRATGWFDNFVHLLGGVWLIFVLILFKNRLPFLKFLERSPMPVKKTVFVVLLITVGWEIFEFGLNTYAENAYGFRTPVGGDTLDTLLDIVLGILGAFIALLYINKER